VRGRAGRVHRRILVPVDGQRPIREALTRACSFGGRPEKLAGRLIAGVHICAGCGALAADILRSEAAS
jgi:ClpX C4-type zinc finger